MSSTGEIWLLRHGETLWTLSGAHTSRTDLSLTPEGQREAVKAGEFLRDHPFALVLSSPMRRALDTARLAGLTPEIVDDLREWDYGEFEGLTTAEIHKTAPDWTIWTMTPRGGETAEMVAARADRVLARAAAAKGDVILVGHGHMSRVLGVRWLGLEPQAGRMFALSTASISILAQERETRVIRMWNRTD
jgi:broad specificity phosphatase PhoE